MSPHTHDMMQALFKSDQTLVACKALSDWAYALKCHNIFTIFTHEDTIGALCPKMCHMRFDRQLAKTFINSINAPRLYGSENAALDLYSTERQFIRSLLKQEETASCATTEPDFSRVFSSVAYAVPHTTGIVKSVMVFTSRLGRSHFEHLLAKEGDAIHEASRFAQRWLALNQVAKTQGGPKSIEFTN